MDGSSPAKKPPAKKPVADAATAPPEKDDKPKAGNDDPFAIAQSPTGQKVLQCAPKPMKGRLHRVVCPMCDTQGFIPKSAIGRQVRCANRKCLVPVFAAPATDEKAAPRAPARVSDQENVTSSKTTKGASEKNPLVIYGIVGAVLLALTLGLIKYLNPTVPNELPPIDMSKFNSTDGGHDPETPVTDPKTDPDPPKVDYRAMAIELVQEMIQTARITSGNRDKAFCRRLTGDAFLRLGMATEAEAEFAQMEKISTSDRRDTGYFRIGPLEADYWKQLSTGDKAAVARRLNDAKALGKEIPRTGIIAVDSSIALAAIMTDSGDASGALALIEGQQRDESVASKIDAVRHGVWTSTAVSLRDAGQESLTPLEVFAWNEPLKTAVGVRLASQHRWQSAIAWASILQDSRTAGDTFAAIARQMIAAAAPDTARQSLVTAAEAKDSDTALRTISVLAQTQGATAFLDKAKALVAALPAAKPISLGSVETVISTDTPDLTPLYHRAEGLADFVIAAVRNEDAAAAADGMQRFGDLLFSQVAPTVELRRICGQIETDEDGVAKRIANELSLTDDNRIRSRFLAYRRGIDRLANVAEERRLVLLNVLGRVIDQGGLSTVKNAIAADDGILKQEVCVDELKGLLFVAAAASGQPYPEITADNSLHVPIARVDPLRETSVVKPLVAAWDEYLKSSNSSSAAKLENVAALPGLRTAMAAHMTEHASWKAASAKAQLASIAVLNDELWREESLLIATRILTKRGMLDEIDPVLSATEITPTQKLVALYGMARGLIDLDAIAKEE